MSNIKGVFFPNQVIPAKALGAFAAKTVTDGVLSGCDISYGGTVLTVGKGYLIACGRVMEISTTATVTVSGAASGYARVSVLVDATKTATKAVFEQADFLVEYAAAADGFADPYDEDINMDGKYYQLPLCVVSLSAAGITGIVTEPQQALGRGRGMEPIWTNASLSSAFPAQSLSLGGLEDCDLFFVLWLVRPSTNSYRVSVLYVPDGEEKRFFEAVTDGSYGSWHTWQRGVTVDRTAGTFEFDDAVYAYSGSSSVYTSVMKPVVILGGSAADVFGGGNGGEAGADESTNLYVTLDLTAAGTLTTGQVCGASHTSALVAAAYRAGDAVYCVLPLDEAPRILRLVSAEEDQCVFFGTDGDALYVVTLEGGTATAEICTVVKTGYEGEPLTIDNVTYQGLTLREIFEDHNLVIGGDFENGLPSLQIGDNTWEFKCCKYTGSSTNEATYIDPDDTINITTDDYSHGNALRFSVSDQLRCLCLKPQTFNVATAGYYFIACQTRIDEWNGSGCLGFQGTFLTGSYHRAKGPSPGQWTTTYGRLKKTDFTYNHTIFLGALPRNGVYPTMVGWIDNLVLINMADVFGSDKEPSGYVCKRLYELYLSLKRDQTARGYMTAFADAMNRKAEELGMSKSSFANPSGMFSIEDVASEGTGNNYSTAADVMKLGLAMLGNPQLMDILKTGRYMCATGGNNRREVTTAGIMNGTGYSTLASRGYLLMGGKGGSGVGTLTGQTSVEAWVSYDSEGTKSSGYGTGVFNMLVAASVGDRQAIVSLLGGLNKQTSANGAYIYSGGATVSVPNWPIIADVLDVIYEKLSGKELSEITIGGSLADGLARATYPISVAACVVPSGNTGSWAGYPTASILSNWTSYAANEDEVKALMSISKVLTALVVLENVNDLNERVTILDSDFVDGSGQLFYEGETLTIRDLLYITLLESNNMTATALGRVVGEKILKQGRARFLTPTTATMKPPPGV